LLGLALRLTSLPPQLRRCITYQEKTLQRWQTVCADGTRGIHRWNPVLERLDSTFTTWLQRPSKEKSRR
jgi:hypothetical protein